MWLYVPALYVPADHGSSDSVPVSADSSSASDSVTPEPTLCALSSGKTAPRPLSWRGWKTRPWHRLLSGMSLPPSTADRGVASWISSLRASRASPSAELATVVTLPLPGASPTPDGSGRTPSASSESVSPAGSSSRTSRRSKTTKRSASSSRTSDVSDTGPRRSSSTHLRLAPLKGERGSLYWPTPTALDARASRNATCNRTRGAESRHHAGWTLTDVLYILPVPDGSATGRNGQPLLNPTFTEVLQGLPVGWTDSTSPVTQFHLWWQRMRSAICGLHLLESGYVSRPAAASTSAELEDTA